jgi:hypothetical protein
MNKDIADIIKRLEKQKTAIDKAILALQGIDEEDVAPVAAVKRGRPKKVGRKRVLSPEAKERIAAAQRKRWAATKRAAKAAKKAA